MTNNELKVTSPDDKHKAIFYFAGEIRFVEDYYYLKINNINLGKRIFGYCCRWSDDSKYFVVQEWNSIDYSRGPQTQLVVFDIFNQKEAIIDKLNKGFLIPKSFLDSNIVYDKTIYDGREFSLQKVEKQLLNIAQWKNL